MVRKYTFDQQYAEIKISLSDEIGLKVSEFY